MQQEFLTTHSALTRPAKVGDLIYFGRIQLEVISAMTVPNMISNFYFLKTTGPSPTFYRMGFEEVTKEEANYHV